MFTLTKRNDVKNGATYGIAGHKGGLFINRLLVEDGTVYPETITVSGDGLNFRPADATATEKQSARAARKAERDAKIVERAAKAQARAEKAAANAAKLAAQAAKHQSTSTPAAQ
jgi:hypothetical protein